MQSTLPAREMTLALLLGGSHLSGTSCSAPRAWLLGRASFNVLKYFSSTKKAKWGVRKQKKRKPGFTISSFEGLVGFFFFPSFLT